MAGLDYHRQVFFRKVCFVVCLCGFILHVVAFLLPTWVNYSIGDYQHYYGVVSTCIVKTGVQICGIMDHESRNGMSRAAQVFSILGLITYFAANICCFISFFWPQQWKRTLLYSSASLAFFTCLCLLLTVILFFSSLDETEAVLDSGFFIEIASALISPLFGVVAIFLARIMSFPPKRIHSNEPITIINLDTVSISSSYHDEEDSDAGSVEVPFYLREVTEDFSTQVPPEHRVYQREETLLFSQGPSEEIRRKIALRNVQKQGSPTGPETKNNITISGLEEEYRALTPVEETGCTNV